MPKRSKPSAKWTKQRLLEYIAVLEEDLGQLKSAAPETVARFTTKQSIIDELYRLYNAPGVPVQKRIDLLETIAREEHGMFREKKTGGGAGESEFATFMRGLTTKELEN